MARPRVSLVSAVLKASATAALLAAFFWTMPPGVPFAARLVFGLAGAHVAYFVVGVWCDGPLARLSATLHRRGGE